MTLAHELYIVDKCVHHAQQASSEGFWRLLMAQLVAGVNVPVEVCRIVPGKGVPIPN